MREARHTCECSGVSCMQYVCVSVCLPMGVSCQRTSEGCVRASIQYRTPASACVDDPVPLCLNPSFVCVCASCVSSQGLCPFCICASGWIQVACLCLPTCASPSICHGESA